MTPAKRLMDVTFSLLLLVILAPVVVLLVVWLLVRQGRPLFYVAERMKSPTQAFGLIKFRTMTVAEEDSGVSGGDKNSRVTPIGARLRAKRLDEIPQLWNILRGDISFVGPRPPLRQYVDRFPEIYGQILKNRPGVTGLATLTFHRQESELLQKCKTSEETDAVYCRLCVPRKARLDLVYQQNRSVCYDFILVFQTIGELFLREDGQKMSARSQQGKKTG